MSATVIVPRNESVLREFGPYRSGLDVGSGAIRVQRQLAAGGLRRFEPATQATLLTLVQLARRRPVQFLDIGAHIGSHSLIVASVYPASEVHLTAFEPTPETSHVFRFLAAANRLQIHIERCAISDVDGTARFYISPWDTSNSLAEGFRPAQDTFDVRTVRLDTYCAEHSLRPDVIKIDVETHEPQVFRGGAEIVQRERPSIVCEILRVSDPAATQETIGVLTDADYHFHRWTVSGGWIECSGQDVVEQVEHDGLDWLFTPNPLDRQFRDAFRDWRDAVAECTPEAAKKKFPAGMGPRLRRYRARSTASH